MADESVQVKFGADIGEATTGIEQVGSKLRDLNPEIRELAETFGGLRRTFVEAFAVDQVAEFISKISEMGESAMRSSAMLGMSVEKVQELGFASKMMGGDSEGTTMMMTRLERSIAEAGNTSSKASQSFAALGITQEDLKNKSPDQVLGMIADAFAGAKDGADKTAIAMDLMGRSGAQMIPLLDQGSEGLKRMGEIADSTGSVMKAQQAEVWEATAQKITTMKAAIEGAGISLAEVLHPGINAAIDGITQLVEWVTYLENGLRLVADIIDDTLIISVAKMGEEFADLGITGVKYIDEVKIAFQTLAQVIDDVVHMHFNQAVTDWQNGMKKIVEAEKTASEEIAGVSQEYTDFKTKVMDATASLFTFAKAQDEVNKAKLQAPTSNASGEKEDDTEEQIERNNLATELELAKISLATKKETDEQKVESGTMSKAQMLADLKDLAAQEMQLDLEALDAEAATYDKDSAQYNELMNKKKIITAQYNEEISKLNAQAATEQEAQWKKLSDTIQQTMDQMVTGVLRGTQTWQQAMARLADNLGLKFAELATNKLVQWMVEQARELTVTQATDAAKVASNDAANNASSDSAGMKAIKQIEADAAATYAGVFAYLSPVLGPAATIPAAASAGLVAGMEGMVSLDVGAWNIPSDMPANLHAGEMVVPATFAEGLRSGGSIGGGTGDIHIHGPLVQAIDTQTGAAFLKNNAAVIAQTLASQVRNFNRNVPAWKQ